MKRFLSMMIVVFLVYILIVPTTINAMTVQDFDTKISQLKRDDPNGSVHYTSSYNGINFGSSCYGWAYMTGYKVFSSNPSSWSTVNNLNKVKKGDVIQYGNTSGRGHTVFVVNVSGNTITFADCNGNGNRNSQGNYVEGLCMVKWDNTTTISANSLFGYSFSYIKSAPAFDNPNPKPSNAYVNVSNTSLLTGKSNKFTFGANNATTYDLTLYKNNTQYAIYSNVKSGVSYTFNEEGNYSVTVTAKNSYGSVTSSKKNFFVMNALDLGSFFVAKIKNPASEMYVATGGQYDSTNYPNVYLASETSNSNNEWMFERQDDFSYKVTNVETGYCLDVSGGSSANGTNIGCYPSNDTTSQRWYIRTNMSYGYALVPKLCLTSDLSIYGNNSLYNNNIFDGANIALYGNDSVKAQRFVFDYILTAPNEWIQIEKTELTSKEKLSFNFGANGATKYTLCVDRYGNRELTEDVQPGDSFSFDKTGDYSAYVLCTIGDNLTTVKTPTVYFYNLLVYDYGEKFTANIKNTGSEYYITTGKQAPNMSYPDVYIASKTTDGSSEWLFERQSDYSYKILNQKTGYALDLYGGFTDNLTNIDTYPDNDTNAQRWFISNNMDGLALVPMNNYHSYLSICGNNSIYGECVFDGANIALYGLDNVKSQRFTLECITDLSPSEPTLILGDVDSNGEVDMMDVTVLMRYLADMKTLTPEQLKAADVDQSEEVDAIDATIIQRALAGIRNPYFNLE